MSAEDFMRRALGADLNNMDPGLWCAHVQTTHPDENGDAICLKCGKVVEIRLNVSRFKRRWLGG